MFSELNEKVSKIRSMVDFVHSRFPRFANSCFLIIRLLSNLTSSAFSSSKRMKVVSEQKKKRSTTKPTTFQRQRWKASAQASPCSLLQLKTYLVSSAYWIGVEPSSGTLLYATTFFPISINWYCVDGRLFFVFICSNVLFVSRTVARYRCSRAYFTIDLHYMTTSNAEWENDLLRHDKKRHERSEEIVSHRMAKKRVRLCKQARKKRIVDFNSNKKAAAAVEAEN